MILTAHQPAYLPWPGLLHKIASADLCVILDNVPFERGSFVNRNRIPTKNGPVWLTIPVHTEGHLERPLSSIQIAGYQWRRKHWETLRQTYQSALRWDACQKLLRAYYSYPWNNLCYAASDSLQLMLWWFGIETTIIPASSYHTTQHKDMLLMELCEKTGADTFLFGGQGRDYADVEWFGNHGVKTLFQRYPTDGAVSAIDLLMKRDDAREVVLQSGGWEG